MSAATSVPPAHSAQLPACGSLILPVGTVTPTAGVVGTLPALEAVGWKPARRLGCAAQRVLLRMAPRRAHLWGASPVRVPGGRRGDPSCLRGGAGIHAHQRIGGGFLVASGMNSRHQDHASRALTPHLGVSPPTDRHLPPGAGSPSAQSAPFPFPLLLLTAHEAVHHPGLHVTCGWGRFCFI